MTGKELDYDEVIKARMDEIDGLRDTQVWEVVPREICFERTGKGPIRGRWVDINKGDDINKVYRSRYVAMEIKSQHGGNSREGLFAAMPPLEALKLLISITVSRAGINDKRDPFKLLFIDISKAYLHANVINDDLYVELPSEMNMPNCCGWLRNALYGTREGAKCWENDYSSTLAAQSCKRGKRVLVYSGVRSREHDICARR